MGSALEMIVCNTFLKKLDTRLITYTSGPSKIPIDYIMVRNKGRKRVIYVKVCDIMICVVKEVKKPFVPKRNVWRLNKDTTRVKSENEFLRLAQVLGQKSGVEDIWKLIMEDLLPSCDSLWLDKGVTHTWGNLVVERQCLHSSKRKTKTLEEVEARR